MTKILFLIALLVSPALADMRNPPSSTERQFLHFKNNLSNGGFEGGKTGWSSAVVITSTSGQVAEGAQGGSWDPSASGTIQSPAWVTKAATAVNAVGSCKILTSDADYDLQVYDGTNIVAEVDVPSSSVFQTVKVNFVAAASTTYRIRLEAQGNEAIAYVDDCYLGEADNIGSVAQATFIGSAYFPITSGCEWQVASATYAPFGSDPQCPAPTVEFNPFGYIQSTDTDLAQITLNNLPPGKYVVTVEGGVDAGGTAAAYAGLAISDSITRSGDHDFYINNADVFPWSLTGVFNYTSAGTRTFDIRGRKTGATTLRISSGAIGGPRFVIYRFPLESELAYKPDVIPWRVDANIGGANPTLGISALTSYTDITNASLDMVQNTGSIPVQIPCSSTNASTGLTCSSGSESLGVVFNLPRAGAALACASFSHGVELDSAGDGVSSTFQIVETPNNAQTILQEGKTRNTSYFNSSAAAAINDQKPFRLCGTFNFSSAGQKTLRLVVEQAVVGTPAASFILGDREALAGQRDIHWEVYPIDQAIPAPLLVGSVTSNSLNAERVERAKVLCSSSSSITSQSGSWVSSIGNIATGTCTLTLATGAFSATPTCVMNVSANNGTVAMGAQVSVSSATSVQITGSYNTGGTTVTSTTFSGELLCMGPK